MVYVDILVITDLFMNYLIVMSTAFILNRTTKFKKVFLSSAVGCIPLIFLFMNINKLLLVIINISFGIIMSIISFKYKNMMYTIKNVLYMYFISIFLSGGVYLINTTLLPKVNNQLLQSFLLIITSPTITLIYIKNIKKIKVINSNYYKVDIYLKDKPLISLNAYLDTGNILVDPYNGKPIILVNRNVLDYEPEKTLLVPFDTIDNHNLLQCFNPEKIYIHGMGEYKKVLIGLIDKELIEDANCILNQKLIERI